MPKSDRSWQNLGSHLRRNLGDGMVDVELTDDQMNDAIEDSLEEFRMRSGAAETEGWLFLDLIEDQTVYSLPNYVSRVMAIERLGLTFSSGFEGQAAANNLYGQYLSGQAFDMLTYHLSRAFLEEIGVMAANTITFRFHSSLDGSQVGYDALSADELAKIPDTRPTGAEHVDESVADSTPNKELQFDNKLRAGGPALEILQRPRGGGFDGKEIVLLNITYGRTDAELISDRETKRWIHDWAESQAMITLGRAYRKLPNIPGPGGGMSLPGAELIQDGKDMQETLRQDLLDFLHGEEPVDILIG